MIQFQLNDSLFQCPKYPDKKLTKYPIKQMTCMAKRLIS